SNNYVARPQITYLPTRRSSDLFQSLSGLNRHQVRGGYTENTSTGTKLLILKNYNTTPFPHNMWIKAEMFVDYNANNVYFYIPTLDRKSTRLNSSHVKISYDVFC